MIERNLIARAEALLKIFQAKRQSYVNQEVVIILAAFLDRPAPGETP